MTPTVIHAFSLRKGIVALAPMPGAGGDFAADMAHFHGWQPSIVLTMVSVGEMAEAGHPDLGVAFSRIGAKWFHFPVRDFDVPDKSIARAWPEISKACHRVLDGGGKVLIHCHGGCGRSGMAALRLMIEAGEAPDAALTRLRGVRPCAVETDAQQAWARLGLGGVFRHQTG